MTPDRLTDERLPELASVRTLAIDVETYSATDLTQVGLHVYTQDPSFEVLLFAYAFDDGPVQIVDLAQGEQIPDDVLDALTDPNILKTAWNAAFELAALSAHLKTPLPTDQWKCTMVHAYYLGLPGSLEMAAKSLRLDVQKDSAGTALIRYFSKPCRPTKTNGGRTRNLPHHDPERWQQFKDYCVQDVRVERAIRDRIRLVPLPEREQRLWVLDQKINNTGIPLDAELVKQAIACHQQHHEKLMAEAVALTGLDNPNSVAQLKSWLREAEGLDVESLNKNTIPDLIKQVECEKVERMLQLRQELSRTSVKKYEAMHRTMGRDGRVRGLLQFYGANRTGRWAGRLVQVQNLPRNTMPDLDLARRLLRAGHHDAIEMLFDSVPDVLSQLIRTAFVPGEGKRFIIADFASIEARVLAWLASEQWRLDVFEDHGKIYEASASQMFRVPIEDVDRELRQKGKIAELALGYGGGIGALKKMGALEMGLTEDELLPLVNSWRKANPAIVEFWQVLESAAFTAVSEMTDVTLPRGIAFEYKHGLLAIHLPAGRELHYVGPRIETDPATGRYTLTYEGYEQGRWGRLRTYGGKLAENITQAVARDCLAEALLRLDAAGYPIAFHVHDEVVLNPPIGRGSTDEVVKIMTEPMPWAPGLPLGAEAFEADYYKKD